MLKITRIDTPAEQRLILEGWLIEPWTAVLTSPWEETRQARRDRKFIIDLRGVTRIDATGESALAAMKSEGAQFLARGIRMKHLLKSMERNRAKRKSQDGPTHVVVPD